MQLHESISFFTLRFKLNFFAPIRTVAHAERKYLQLCIVELST